MGRVRLKVQSKKRAVFLDRDGGLNEVIIRNGKPYPPRDLSELVITNGTREALDELKREGFLQIVVTNQPDVARAPQIAPISKRSTRSLALFCRSIR
jgi:D-glycero-D-manno-heptose 1,7-bisphosphate phosphatase